MHKKLVALALSAAMVASFTGCQNASGSSSAATSAAASSAASGSASSGSSGAALSGEVKIGAVMPLTGSVAAFGQSGQKALQLLEDQVNADGGINGQKLTFVFVDDEGKPATAATVGKKLIDNDKVVAIVGPLTSNCALSLAPIAQQYKIPMVTGTGTNEKVTKVGDFIFRTCFIDPFQGKVVAKLASSDLKAQTAAMLYDNGNDYSKGLAQNFQKSFEANGGKVVSSETYLTGDKDFNAQLTKIAATNPDVLFLPDYYSTVAVIAKQARSAGIKATFLGGDGWDSADLFKIGGDAVNGAYFSNHYSPDDTSAEVVQFIKDFKSKYNTTDAPDAMAALNYDAGKVLVQSIQKAGSTDSAAIQSALKAYDGTVVSGHIKFDENRDAIKSAVIIKTDGGKETFYTKVEP
ncbi:ABC transporter substrate-binding protein [Caproicibacter fermentans]|uniref:ABC transporter substrate-binding protein n=1 Tax=Caproicibacter fermentans TaxID=2576756 RepID=A0A7G8TB14_9FIRM|nr:ABC transporter substrate-binding protein [Caproicibacter fermentans]QNK40805.1 ABC transporter substrate-binding protein [Caproicibacter fermentans]